MADKSNWKENGKENGRENGEHCEEEEEGSSSSCEEESEKIVMVIDAGIKHPLKRSWTMWFDSTLKKERSHAHSSWEENLKQLLTVSTIEDFWGLYNNIQLASRLSPGCNYHFFVKGIRPAWEDKANEKGGKWVVIFKRRSVDLDKKWLWTLLSCIGEHFPAPEQICGAVISIKQQAERIALWTSAASDVQNTTAIGKHLKTTVLETDQKVTFHAHEEALHHHTRHSSKFEV
mmetsp:Transcript_36685/g.50488  ORF Transcript_36685/g.50488 Transcript_36685/m.50488 type:complete len:232 (+) Transcript_36685:203-898(+)|eukprot:CAMPEP_0201478756 /NCGR_PEP_ID=MMETSP0151_2-20130828/3530_1 /ASSEMBLY_ACC=CAM_ASM_000257 /TAXON_ID=200890 /ORGANISM="Paramoeba atlantica, Strain 621/1 / CCAP 1560/9" /LENGTH=231 /DNA_ID=CAMNT_0047859941 /DNA_START=287 /DNA_END=982 /DNA_ORIENTATION=-